MMGFGKARKGRALPRPILRFFAPSRSALSRPPLLPQLRPIIQPLPDLAFETAFDGIIEFWPAQAFRKIILARERFRRVVIVMIAFAVALLLHQPGRRVEDMLGRQQ